jgi:hypothetical protein
VDPADRSLAAYKQRLRNMLLAGVATDVHREIEKDRELAAMHAGAEQFKPETEEVFKYLQVCVVGVGAGGEGVELAELSGAGAGSVPAGCLQPAGAGEGAEAGGREMKIACCGSR